ncbi:MAG: response regulator [Fibrobacter sp.]|nr:response regulator [Fibrobacter sp.]
MYNKRILVVDDEEAILLAFRKLLKRPNVEVDTCECIEDAKAKIDSIYYDAVIADLRLSGTLGQEGFEIISYIRNKSKETRIALITAYGSSGTFEKAMGLGADLYFEKPVSMGNLNEVLESIGVK